MSDTVDVGIDLGTTNSVIALMEAGGPVVVKNGASEVTPSCIGISPDGQVHVGLPAVGMAFKNPERVAEGFKRQLGTNDTRTFPGVQGQYTAVNLAGLLLGDLRRAISEYLNEEPNAAVITVPAAFGEVEKHAVTLAANEGGFAQVTVVQEPVAAGLAYGWDKSALTKPFLIYDVGGGTFDASLMECVAGQLVVRSHSGEHTLGGRDLDAQILDELVEPRLRTRADPASWAASRTLLQWMCEQAKIRLSRSPSATLAIEGRVISTTGQPIEDVVTITVADYERLLNPFVDRTIGVVQSLLHEAGVKVGDLAAIVMVGGPSKTPGLRKRLQEQLHIPQELIYTRVDPMTVVAQGAALFAATIPKLKTTNSPSHSTALPIRLAFDRVTSLEFAPIGLATDRDSLPQGARVRIKRGDGMWASGLAAMSGGKAIVQVALIRGQQNSFQIEVVDAGGIMIPVTPNEFSVLQGISAAPPPLSRSIGVVVESSTVGGLSMDVIAPRGSPTPLTAKQTYRTTRAIGPGDPTSALEITFLEGESIRPLRNREVCKVSILGTEIDRPMPIGTEVEITLRIDPAASPTAKVYIPLIGKTFTNKAVIGVDVSPTPGQLKDRLTSETLRLEDLSRTGLSTTVLEGDLPRIHRELNLAEHGDRDGIARAVQQLSSLEQRIDALEEKAGPRVAMAQLAENQDMATTIVEQFGDDMAKERLMGLNREAVLARSTDNQHAVRNVSDSLARLARDVYWAQPAAWVQQFNRLCAQGNFVDRSKAETLILKGRGAIDTGDVSVLRQTVLDLVPLTPSEGRDATLAKLGGLAR